MKVRRDEKGAVILNGSETFGNYVRPKGRHFDTNGLKSQASFRILRLMKAKNICIKEDISDNLRLHNEFALQSPIVHFAYYRNKLKNLKDELSALKICGNNRKIRFKEPVIMREIKEVNEELDNLGKEILNERRVLSRKRSD